MDHSVKSKLKRMSPLNDAALIRESWKIFQIMAEFVEGFERLALISPSVSVFGSARTKPEHPNYKQAEKISEVLSNAGFSAADRLRKAAGSPICLPPHTPPTLPLAPATEAGPGPAQTDAAARAATGNAGRKIHNSVTEDTSQHPTVED